MPNLTRRFALLLLLLCLPALGGCALPVSITPEPAPTQNPLADSTWVLKKLGAADVLTGTRITLELADGQLSGSDGCVAYSSDLILEEGGAFLPAELESVEEVCAQPEDAREQTAAYLDTLRRVTRFSGGGRETLYLLDDAGLLLTLERRDSSAMNPADLQNIAWQLVSMGAQAPVRGSHISIQFSGGGMEGFAGCRGFKGVYQAQEDRVSFGTYNMLGESACNDPARLAQEQQFLDYLSASASYWTDGEQLEIYTADGVMLVFEAAQ